jgi:hypothetical protein
MVSTFDSQNLKRLSYSHPTFICLVAARIREYSGAPVTVLINEVPKAWAMQDAYCQLIPCNDEQRMAYSMIPRIGAFEVSYKGILVYSKLLTTAWPHAANISKQIASMLTDSNNGMNENALRQKYQTLGSN